jgi:hypothetical protein
MVDVRQFVAKGWNFANGCFEVQGKWMGGLRIII